MSKQVIVIDSTLSVDGFKSVCNLAPGRHEGLTQLRNYFSGLNGGLYSADVTALVGAIAADGYVRVAAGGSTNDQAMTLLNVTLTAKTSASLANEFTISATAATQAANMATAINASASFAGKVTALASGGDVLLYAVVPGASGNGLQVAVGNLSNVTLPKPFAGGSDGTQYDL